MRRLQAALGGSVRVAAAGCVAPRTRAAFPFSFFHFVFATIDEFPATSQQLRSSTVNRVRHRTPFFFTHSFPRGTLFFFKQSPKVRMFISS